MTYIYSDDLSMNTMVIYRQTLMAIELLFVQIPIRFNFSLEHVEI
jgi:hypothetical protein